VVSRLSEQKGIDLVLAALPALLEADACLAVLGSGDAGLRDGLVSAASSYPGRVGVEVGYDETLAHLIQAGCDALLVPSRFEPCGQTQLCALRYGAVPVVSRVGGLADTVIDANLAALAAGVATGVQFEPVTADALTDAIRRVARLWSDRTAWRRMQGNGMGTDVSWSGPARAYAALYRDAIGS
jgi:starch synthase